MREAEPAASSAVLRKLLRRRGLTTINDVVAWSRVEYADRQYHLYSGIFGRVDKGRPPTIHRLEALRAATGLSRRDLYALVGIDLDLLPLHSSLLHANRTRPIQSSAQSSSRLISLPNRLKPVATPAWTMPLTEIVADWSLQPQSRLEGWRQQVPEPCLYLQVGLRDGMSYPQIAPGMIVQIDPSDTDQIDDGRLYAFEHPYGYSVCHATVEEGGTVVLLSSTYGLYPELKFPRRLVRVLGRVRACCGRIDNIHSPAPIKEVDLQRVYRNERNQSDLAPPLTASIRQSALELFRVQRDRLGITYDELNQMTRQLHELAGLRFGVGRTRVHDLIHGASSVVERPAVVYALAACFALDFEDVLISLGVDVRETKAPEPLNPENPVRKPALLPRDHELAANLLASWLEWPAILPLLGPDLRTSTVFYFNQPIDSIEPLIKPHAWLLVDSTQRTIATTIDGRPVAELPEWARPIYLLLTHQGYLCGYCEGDAKTISVVAHPRSADQRRHTFSLHDVDIVGRVSGVATLL